MRMILRKVLAFFQGFCRFLWSQLPLFVVLLLIQTIQIGITYYYVGHVGLGLCMGTIAWAFIFILPQCLFKTRYLRIAYAIFITTVNSIMGLIQLFCALKIEEMVFSTHIMLMANTNLEEATEFITTFIDVKLVMAVIGIAVSAIFMYKLMLKIRYTKIGAMIFAVVLLCALAVTEYFNIWKDCGVGRVINAIVATRNHVSYNLEETQALISVKETHNLHPNIILIIGESFDKNHSNIYGYSKNTTPLLSKKQQDSMLVVFSNVQSSAPITNLSIRQMLSLSDSYDDGEWYTKAMLTTALSKGGYNTQWISNQMANSVFDNALGQFAQLSDSVVYTSNEYMAAKTRFDEVLFEPFREYVKQRPTQGSNFCVIHLMGSHANYELRYPNDFSIFKPSDYIDQPEHRRSTFAAYDNSILYNDYVVDSLLNISDNMEAVVIYLSDHGQDFYYTRDLASHGRISDPVSFEVGCQIPFMIYFTKSFRQKYNDIIERVRQKSHEKFETKYLMNTILDVAGYDICDSSVYEKSLFVGKFCSKVIDN